MRIGVNGRFLAGPVTGVQRFGREILRGLARDRVALLVPDGTEVPEDFEGEVLRGRLSGHPWEQLELPGLARGAGCDVVLHPANTAPWRRHRSVVVVHDPMFPLSHPEWFTRRYALWQKHAIAPALRRASRLLTVSEWSRVHLARELGVPADRIGVVPQGLAPYDAPAPPEQISRVRREHGLPGPFVIAFGGRDPRKHIRFLAPVADELARLRPDVAFVVIGDAYPRVHPPDTRVERSTLRRLGQLDARDAHPLLTAAAALCFPSLAEGFGRPPLEALACGTPAVVGDYGAAREVLGDAATILPWDPSAWVRALIGVLDDPGARTRALGAADRLRARYSWEAASDVLRAECLRVAGARPERVRA